MPDAINTRCYKYQVLKIPKFETRNAHSFVEISSTPRSVFGGYRERAWSIRSATTKKPHLVVKGKGSRYVSSFTATTNIYRVKNSSIEEAVVTSGAYDL